jgi:hypothetical protein
MVDDASRPKISGRLIRPATVADLPREIWKYCDRNTVPPKSATPTSVLATTASATVRLRKMPSGMIGSAARDSVHTASASRSTPPQTNAAVCHEPQAKCRPARVDQISSVQTPAMISSAPSQSTRTGRRTTGRCSVRCSRAIAASENGMPMRKHQRQPSQDVSTSTPPISGPAMVATPNTAPNRPE